MHSCRLVSKALSYARYSSVSWSEYSDKFLKFGCNYGNTLRHSSNKAAVCHHINKPLKIEEAKEMKLKKGEVKIKVNYCGLNRRDVLLLNGRIATTAPFIPGYEVSGEVVEKIKGDNDSENCIEVGDKVVALTKSSLGGLRSYCVALQKDVWKCDTLEPKVAAGLIVNYGHALLSLFRRAKIKKDTTVLITADAGGLGLAALDIAANVYKAKVIGVCGSEEKADMLRERGAWSALKMNLVNLKASVQDVTGNKGVSVVYETVGGDFLTGAMQCVMHEGLLILADPTTEYSIKTTDLFNFHSFNMAAVSLDQYREHDFPVYRQAVSDVIELCEQNLIAPHVFQSYDLDDINDAVKVLGDDKIIGKVLIKVPH